MTPRPTRSARDWVVRAQWSLLVFLVAAIAIHPGLVLKWNEAGLSNYGIHAATVVPYSLALGLCAAFSTAGARSLGATGPPARRLRALLLVYAGLMVLSLLSTYTYTLNVVAKDAHIVVDVTTALFDVAASWWMYRRLRAGPSDGVWLGVQMAGSVLALVDFLGLLHVLFVSQALAALGFGVLVVYATGRASHGAT